MALKNLIAKSVTSEKQNSSCSKNITAEPIAGCSKDMFAGPIADYSKDVPKPVADFSKNMLCTEFVSSEIGEETPENDVGFEVPESPVKEIITSHKESGSFCSPQEIIPVPQCSQNITEQKPRRTRGKTAVITSSPYYLELKEKNKVIPVKVVAPVKRNVFGGKKKENTPILVKKKEKKKLNVRTMVWIKLKRPTMFSVICVAAFIMTQNIAKFGFAAPSVKNGPMKGAHLMKKEMGSLTFAIFVCRIIFLN